MDGAAFHVGTDDLCRQLPAAARVHSKSRLTDGSADLSMGVPRKLLQQAPIGQVNLETADETLFVVLIVCGGIGLLILATFGIIWCVYSSRRRSRSDSDESDSLITDADESFTEEEKPGSYIRAEEQRPAGYGSERKLAVSAQLYHYEKQKRELLALEQGGQSELVPSPRGTPPPTYSSQSKGDRLSDASVKKRDGTPVQGSRSLASNSKPANKFSDEEDFAVYEYPGLVTTVGQIEIDNPLFRPPHAHTNDLPDADGRLEAAADAEPSTPFDDMSVQIVRQQPDLLMAIDDAGSSSRSADGRSSHKKRKSKHRNSNSPNTTQAGSSSDSSPPKPANAE